MSKVLFVLFCVNSFILAGCYSQVTAFDESLVEIEQRVVNSLAETSGAVGQEKRYFDQKMSGEFFKIAGLVTVLSIVCSIVHSQITYRVCPEFFNSPVNPHLYEIHKRYGLDKFNSQTLIATVWGLLASWSPSLISGIVVALASRLGAWKKLTCIDLRCAAYWLCATLLLAPYLGVVFQPSKGPIPLSNRVGDQALRHLFETKVLISLDVSAAEARKVFEDFDHDLDNAAKVFEDNPVAKNNIFAKVGGFYDAACLARILYTVLLSMVILAKRSK